MKTNRVAFQTRVMTDAPNGEFVTLGTYLEDELCNACRAFLQNKGNTDNLLERARQLSIDQRVALGHYMTGLKIQNFANNAEHNDSIKLDEEVNSFLKQYDKITK